jgi:hypothetical protein
MSAADLNQPFHVLGMAVVGLANTTLTLHALQPWIVRGREELPVVAVPDAHSHPG